MTRPGFVARFAMVSASVLGLCTFLAVPALPFAALPPGLAPVWSAHLTCFGGWFSSTWYVDLAREAGPRFRQIDVTQSITFGNTSAFIQDTNGVVKSGVSDANVTYYGGGPDAVCAPHSQAALPIVNPFPAALSDQSVHWGFNGTTVVQGTPCKLWYSTGGDVVCVDDLGAPLAIVIGGGVLCNISNVSLGPIGDEYFRPNQECERYPVAPCPEEGVANITVFRLHSSGEPLALDNRDFADAAAAPTIACDWPTSKQEGTHMSMWLVAVNTSFGQYGRCHFNGTNYCDASTGIQVGREAPQGVGPSPLQGQCSANLASGSWYSFPAEGGCSSPEAVGGAGCTWSGRRLRTIDAACIVSKAEFQKACRSELGRGFVYRESARIIQAAFASDDPEKGGCPDAMLAAPLVV